MENNSSAESTRITVNNRNNKQNKEDNEATPVDGASVKYELLSKPKETITDLDDVSIERGGDDTRAHGASARDELLSKPKETITGLDDVSIDRGGDDTRADGSSVRDELLSKPKETITDLEGVPIDRGWAWVLLAGCVLYAGMYGGIMRSFGVFFLQYQEQFQAKAAEVAISGVVENITSSIIGLVVMTIGLKRFSCRAVVATGAGFISLAYITSGFVKDIRMFYISLGLFGGVGISLVRLPTMSIIGIYFEKHRGLATSIYTGSASVGGLIFAPIVTTLFSEYGYTGTMLIVGGLFLNIFVSASVMRPPSWFAKRCRKATENGVTEKLLDGSYETNDHTLNTSPNDQFNPAKLGSEPLPQHYKALKSDSNEIECKGNILQSPNAKKSLCGKYRSSDLSSMTEDDSDTFQSKSVYQIRAEDTEVSNKDVKTNIDDTETESTKRSQSLKVNVFDALITAFDVKLLKDGSFILYLAMSFCLVSGMILVFIYLPPFAKDVGMSYSQIAIMISAMACTDFVSKIVSGFVADRKWLRRSTLLGLAASATGSFCHFARFYTTLPSVMTMAVIMACFYGWYPSMYSPILVDCVGLNKLQSSLGFVSLVHGISVGIFYPITGLLRDISGSYIYSLHLTGGLCYLGAILLFLMPVVQTIKEKTNKTDNDEEEKA